MLSKVYAVVWSKWRPYMSVGAKTVAAFSMIIAVLAGGFYYYIDTTLSSQARSEAVQELSVKARGAVGIYRSRMAQMKYGMLQAGSMESVQRAISGREGRFLRETVDRFAGMRPYVDYWAVVDADGNSIVSRNGTAPAAVTVRKAVGSTGSGALMEDITVKRIISRALSTGTAILTTEVVESGRFGRISAEGTATAPERPKRATELMQVVVTPVTSGSGVTGAFVTGILLDGYGWLTETVNKNFGVESAIFDFTGGSVKIITASTGARALLTDGTGRTKPVDNRLMDKYGFTGTVEAGGTGAFVAVEPLFDYGQGVVGGIAVMVPSAEVFAGVIKLKHELMVLVFVSALFSMLLAWLTYRDITRPIGALVSAMKATTGGECGVRVDIRTKDEFEHIGAGFNTMIGAVEVRDEKLNDLVEFVRILIANCEPDMLIKNSLLKIVEMTASTVGVVYVKDTRTGIMWPAESIGLAEGGLETFICNEKLTCKLEASHKRAVYVNQVDEKMLLQAGFTGAVPDGLEYFVMCNNGLLSGVFMVGRAQRGYRDVELEHVEHLVTQFAIALDNSYSHKEVERLSITDPLTGLHNRRYFRDRFKIEFISAKRYNYTVAVLMIDIDDFKSINDTFGHQAGDTVLKKVTGILLARTRTTDVWARYGGEEFIGFVSHCNAEGTVTLAEKIRLGVEAAVFEELGERKVTVSIGMSLYPSATAGSYDEVVKEADEQLYIAKSNGKNMVSVSKELLQSIAGNFKAS